MATVPARYELEVEVLSASDLKNVNAKHGALRLHPYVMASVEDGGDQKDSPLSSATSSTGSGTNPVWKGCRMILPLPGTVDHDRVVIWLDVVHHDDPDSGDGSGELVIGSGCIFLNEVIAALGVPGRKVRRAVELERPSGRRQGVLQVKVGIRHHSTKPTDGSRGFSWKSLFHWVGTKTATEV